jgi:hypothetical protein
MFLLEKPFFYGFTHKIEDGKIAIPDLVRIDSESVNQRDILKWVISPKKINKHATNQFTLRINQY